ncbi:Ltp family lipoprotein [Dietzia maris]
MIPDVVASAPTSAPRVATDVSASQRNATRSAEQYLAISEFSRSGLIEQLQYDGYSADQASHGATAAGL